MKKGKWQKRIESMESKKIETKIKNAYEILANIDDEEGKCIDDEEGECNITYEIQEEFPKLERPPGLNVLQKTKNRKIIKSPKVIKSVEFENVTKLSGIESVEFANVTEI